MAILSQFLAFLALFAHVHIAKSGPVENLIQHSVILLFVGFCYAYEAKRHGPARCVFLAQILNLFIYLWATALSPFFGHLGPKRTSVQKINKFGINSGCSLGFFRCVGNAPPPKGGEFCWMGGGIVRDNLATF